MKPLKHMLLIALLVVSVTTFSQKKHYVLALSKAEHKLFVLNYQTLDTITKIPVGDDPHEIVTNSDGSLAYVSVPLMNANGHEIDVVNLKTLKPEKVIDTRPFFIPHGLVYLNNKLWFTAQGSKAVAVYDVATDKVEQVFGTGQDFTHLIHVSRNGNSFYTTNVESGTLSIYEKKELPAYMPPTGVLPPNAKSRVEWRQTLINVGLGAEGFAITPDEKELWTVRPDGHIIVVDLQKKEVKADIQSNIQGLHRLEITPDGKTVCVVSVKTGDLLFYNAQSHQVEKQIITGKGAGLYIDKESNRLFVSCTSDNYIAVVDLSTKKEIKRITIGRPDGVIAVIIN